MKSSDAPDPVMFALPAEAVGRIRRELVWTLGERPAHGVLARTGLSWGQADAYFGREATPAMKNLGGATRVPSDDASLIFVTDSSVEAAQHLSFFKPDSAGPQCWLMAGYLTGLMSHLSRRPVFFVETHCVANNDSRCRFEGRSRDAWAAGGGDLSIYDEHNAHAELVGIREQLRLTKERYQNLFEQSSSAIFLLDPAKGTLLEANLAAEELTGYSREELLQNSLYDLCHPQERAKIAADMHSMAAGARIADREISLIRKDGLIRIIAQSSKMLNFAGKQAIQTIMRDVTDLRMSSQKEKDLQHQLMRSERLSSIGRLAAGVAHELKNPLGAIRNAVYYIRNALINNPVIETDPHLKNIMKLAEEEVDQAVVIISELLDFSRVVHLVPRHTLINDLLGKIPDIIPIPENVSLEWELDGSLGSTLVDPDRLNQVFCNMVINAIQAMPEGGQLRIRSSQLIETFGEDGGRREMVAISFEDTGVGIDPVHMAKIFEPLFTTKARGTGLGLAISNNIVEKHGGAILVRSQKEKGTTFTVKIPLNRTEEKGEES